jgi:hypothetical protein
MMMRLFDSWVHEQDMRRAVDRPGNDAGPVLDAVLAWHRRNIGYVVGKRAHAPDGVAIAFHLEDAPPHHQILVRVTDGRAHVVETSDAATSDATPPDVTLTCTVDTFNALLCGRGDGVTAIATGRLRIRGDDALGRRVAGAMNYLF